MSRQQPQPKSAPLSAGDLAVVDGSATVYYVRAISRTGLDAYLTQNEDTIGGTWVALESISRTEGATR